MSRKSIADGVIDAYPRHTFVNNDPENYDAEFSHSACEMCDGLAGLRYTVSAIIIGVPDSEKEQVDFSVCQDCMYYVAYGEYQDN